MAAVLNEVDFIIRNGRVIDPANGLDSIADVAVLNSRVVEVGEKLDLSGKNEFDATGCLVTPGLIDCHIHGYQYCTPLGVNVDSTCLSRGVTTVVDAGSSGASTFPGLRKFIVEQSKTRVLAFLHIAAHGLAASGCSGGAGGGECESLHVVDVDQCVKCIEDNRDVIVGVKVRLSTDVTNEGKHEQEVYRRALDASNRAQLPLMIHHAISSVPSQGSDDNTSLTCPGDMRIGDIYTHTYHGFESSILDPVSKKVYPDVWDAKKRGVIFDCGHGRGAFCWTVAELATREGFWPDTISTDLHTANMHSPAYDLPTVMTKFLAIGMPLFDVIKATTSAAANAIHKADDIGSLSIGREADITVLKLEECDVHLEDCQSQLRNVKTRIRPVAVWRDGKPYEVTEQAPWPNTKELQGLATLWKTLIVRDDQPPGIPQPTF